jgi:hypothetical protein
MNIAIEEIAPAPPAQQNDLTRTRYSVTARIEGLGIVRLTVERPDLAAGQIADTIDDDIKRWMRESLESSGFVFVPSSNALSTPL